MRASAALASSVALSRAREAPTAPQLPPLRRRPTSPISCSRIPDRGDRWSGTLAPPLVRSAGAGEVAGRAERGRGPSPTRWPTPQPAKGALELARATLGL